MTPGVIQAALT